MACLGFVLAMAAPARAATLYVDDDAASGGDGSLARPFQSLQLAIDAAASGDDVFVAGGTYAAISVTGKELHLYGGYDGAFAARGGAVPSVIQGAPSAPVVSLFETGSSILDGFVVRGGHRGLFIDADFMSTTNRPLIRNDVIEANDTASVDENGGGVLAIHCTDARFVGNTVRGNAAGRGAAMATACASVLLENNVIENNIASSDHGGGLYLTGATIVVRGNLIRGNEVGVIAGYGWGGGAIVYGAGVTVSFERNVFTGNHAQSLGSGVFIDDGATATFDGDLFYANRCGSDGGAGIFVDGYDTIGSHVRLVNVTIAEHPCPTTRGNAVAVQLHSTVEIVNSIFWNNGGDDVENEAGTTLSATYTLSEEPIAGVGNVSADPLFFDPAAGDFHVRSTRGRFDPSTRSFVRDAADSASIDAGDPTSDFAMEPGPNGMRVNLGHTGNTPEASMGGPGGTPPSDGGLGVDAGHARDGGASTSGATGCTCRMASASPHPALAAALSFFLLAIARRRARSRGRASA